MENDHDLKPMTVGDWMVTLLILALPLVNIIMLLVWAFSSTGNVSRRNYCRASLLWFLIMMALSVIVFIILAALGILAGEFR